ncbi:MAG: endolytic transglycosylase MltG [Nitrococcus mobilis]|nr:endolytic transglycosylase MltG [Nitrococcus mobilis]
MWRPRRIALILLVGELLIGSGVALGVAVALKNLETEPLFTTGGQQIVEVSTGTSFAELANQLEQRGWIEYPRLVSLYGRLSGRASVVKAGEYAVEPGMTLLHLLDRIVAGAVIQHKLTLIEGWTFRELLRAVESHPALRHTLPCEAAVNVVMAQLGYAGEDPEGRFLPETYLFPRGTTDVAFLKRAYVAMQQELEVQWRQRAAGLPLTSPYQALILASLVEKETALPEERRRIAGVFIRRLERGMRLQADPSIIYGLGAHFDGDIRGSDLREDSPYNTYTRKGLPPTPIALPGRDAIAAVLHPAAGEALYFVARGDGSHKFSATLAAHNQAVRKYVLHE